MAKILMTPTTLKIWNVNTSHGQKGSFQSHPHFTKGFKISHLNKFFLLLSFFALLSLLFSLSLSVALSTSVVHIPCCCWQKTLYLRRLQHHVFPHPGTNIALHCLTSVIWWEPVFSMWYGRSLWLITPHPSCALRKYICISMLCSDSVLIVNKIVYFTRKSIFVC